ncbi:MAG: hypothetical protein GY754_08225 [bacterium]|nr:hypothetical protein [bacterium]
MINLKSGNRKGLFARDGSPLIRSDQFPIKPEGRNWCTMAYIGEGTILLFGGYNGKKNLNDTWLYTVSNHTWLKFQ